MRGMLPTWSLAGAVIEGPCPDASVSTAMLCYCGRHLMRDEEGVLVCAVCKLPPPRCRCLPLGVG